MNPRCRFRGCTKETKPGHSLCYEHYTFVRNTEEAMEIIEDSKKKGFFEDLFG